MSNEHLHHGQPNETCIDADRRAEQAEAAVERGRDVLDGWDHDGPDDYAMHLLIQRVREALDGSRAGEEPCPTCGGSMRFCECMDDPFAQVPSDSSATNCMHVAVPVDELCQTCGCGKDGGGDCPCGCLEAVERAREAFALGAAWALGDDEEAPAALKARAEVAESYVAEFRAAWKSAVTRTGLAEDRADRAESDLARLRSAADKVGHQAVCPVDPCDCWMHDLAPLLDDDPEDQAGCSGLCGDHQWLDRPESDARECLICGTEAAG